MGSYHAIVNTSLKKPYLSTILHFHSVIVKIQNDSNKVVNNFKSYKMT